MNIEETQCQICKEIGHEFIYVNGIKIIGCPKVSTDILGWILPEGNWKEPEN